MAFAQTKEQLEQLDARRRGDEYYYTYSPVVLGEAGTSPPLYYPPPPSPQLPISSLERSESEEYTPVKCAAKDMPPTCSTPIPFTPEGSVSVVELELCVSSSPPPLMSSRSPISPRPFPSLGGTNVSGASQPLWRTQQQPTPSPSPRNDRRVDEVEIIMEVSPVVKNSHQPLSLRGDRSLCQAKDFTVPAPSRAVDVLPSPGSSPRSTPHRTARLLPRAEAGAKREAQEEAISAPPQFASTGIVHGELASFRAEPFTALDLPPVKNPRRTLHRGRTPYARRSSQRKPSDSFTHEAQSTGSVKISLEEQYRELRWKLLHWLAAEAPGGNQRDLKGGTSGSTEIRDGTLHDAACEKAKGWEGFSATFSLNKNQRRLNGVEEKFSYENHLPLHWSPPHFEPLKKSIYLSPQQSNEPSLSLPKEKSGRPSDEEEAGDFSLYVQRMAQKEEEKSREVARSASVLLDALVHRAVSNSSTRPPAAGTLFTLRHWDPSTPSFSRC